MDLQQFFLDGYNLSMKQLVERVQSLSIPDKNEYVRYLSYLLTR